MKKTYILLSLALLSTLTISCVGLITKPIRETKCYGLAVCKNTPEKCEQDDTLGLYQMKTRPACKIDGGHTL